MERPGQRPRGGHLRRGGDPALDPAWPAPVGHRRKSAVLDPHPAQLDKRATNARAWKRRFQGNVIRMRAVPAVQKKTCRRRTELEAAMRKGTSLAAGTAVAAGLGSLAYPL